MVQGCAWGLCTPWSPTSYREVYSVVAAPVVPNTSELTSCWITYSSNTKTTTLPRCRLPVVYRRHHRHWSSGQRPRHSAQPKPWIASRVQAARGRTQPSSRCPNPHRQPLQHDNNSWPEARVICFAQHCITSRSLLPEVYRRVHQHPPE
jgi:hypothetical protein